MLSSFTLGSALATGLPLWNAISGVVYVVLGAIVCMAVIRFGVKLFQKGAR